MSLAFKDSQVRKAHKILINPGNNTHFHFHPSESIYIYRNVTINQKSIDRTLKTLFNNN